MDDDLIQLRVADVKVAVPAGNGVEAGLVVLEEEAYPYRTLRMFIGQPEARAIHVPWSNTIPPRPSTWDLFVSTIAILDGRIERVVITDVEELRHYFAQIAIVQDEEEEPILITARPSDALALALRSYGAKIYAHPHVLDEAGVLADGTRWVPPADELEPAPDPEPTPDEGPSPDPEPSPEAEPAPEAAPTSEAEAAPDLVPVDEVGLELGPPGLIELTPDLFASEASASDTPESERALWPPVEAAALEAAPADPGVAEPSVTEPAVAQPAVAQPAVTEADTAPVPPPAADSDAAYPVAAPAEPERAPVPAEPKAGRGKDKKAKSDADRKKAKKKKKLAQKVSKKDKDKKAKD